MSVQCGLGCRDRAAGLMPHHDDEGNVQRFHGVFQAAKHRKVDSLASCADHKSIAESLVKDQFDGSTRV